MYSIGELKNQIVKILEKAVIFYLRLIFLDYTKQNFLLRLMSCYFILI